LTSTWSIWAGLFLQYCFASSNSPFSTYTCKQMWVTLWPLLDWGRGPMS
jgi:hypothetical protein